jgi:predicted RNase H-like HicB family nuclease
VTVYRLFVESGPKRRKTMVHVPDLLGCIGQGPTTDGALDATPEAIRNFADFLRDRELNSPDPSVPFETVVEEHVTEGIWLGNGDPSIVFACDEAVVAPKDLGVWVPRFLALRDATVELVAALPPAQVNTKPAKGRSVGDIVRHVMGAAPQYVRTFGPVTEMNRLARQAEKEPDALVPLAADQGDLLAERLRSLTPAERKAVQHRGEAGQNVWTARKSFRRLLEHEWEHHRELAERLG